MKTIVALLLCCSTAFGQSAIGIGRSTGKVAAAGTPLAIVRSTKATGASVSSLTITLPSAPAVGNTLVVFMGFVTNASTPGTPAGTWAHVGGTSSAHARMDIWTHAVVSGDGASYTFTDPAGSDRISLVMYEVAGANAMTPVNQSSIVSAGSVSTVTTPALTPSVVGTLALSALVTNTSPTVSSVSTGWGVDQNAQPGTHGTVTASMSALTTNTTTAISSTFTLASAVETIAATVLLGP